ncbi:MAG: Ig-like domain-containing protein, partial [candidate division KSB1 bacterium]|nr:Ig-like domain-containing protein [candidate division KSB1 bacterium]
MIAFNKILAHPITIVVIFLMFSLAGWTRTAAAPFSQDVTTASSRQDSIVANSNVKPVTPPPGIQCDKKPPYFILVHPQPDTINVPLKTTIKFYVLDDFTPKPNEWDKFGVDTSRIFIYLKWRSFEKDSLRPKITLIDSVYKIYCEYQPPQAFDWNDAVVCSIYVWDRSYLQNFADTTFTFYPLRDTTPPVIEPVDPLANAVDVPVDSPIVFKVWDTESHVDVSSVWLKIASRQVNVDHAKPDSNKTVGDTVYFRYKPDTDFAYDDLVKVEVQAADSVGNQNILGYQFKTIGQDTTPPLIVPLDPLPGDTGVSLGANITFAVTDKASHPDTSKITVTVTSYHTGQPIAGAFTKKVIQPDSVYCVFDPTANLLWGDSITVVVEAADSAGNTATKNYGFRTTNDTTPPLIVPLDPLPGDIGVSLDANITFAVTDKASH